MKRILLGVDGSDHAMRAAKLAGEFGAAFDAVVDIVHVIPDRRTEPPSVAHEYARLEHVYVTERDILDSVGRQVVDHAARAVTDAGGSVGAQDVLIGDVAKTIAEVADRSDADCIVTGRRGLGDVRGMLLGSVSHKLGHLTSKTLITAE